MFPSVPLRRDRSRLSTIFYPFYLLAIFFIFFQYTFHSMVCLQFAEARQIDNSLFTSVPSGRGRSQFSTTSYPLQLLVIFVFSLFPGSSLFIRNLRHVTLNLFRKVSRNNFTNTSILSKYRTRQTQDKTDKPGPTASRSGSQGWDSP